MLYLLVDTKNFYLKRNYNSQDKAFIFFIKDVIFLSACVWAGNNKDPPHPLYRGSPAATIFKASAAQCNKSAADLCPEDDRWTLQSFMNWSPNFFFLGCLSHTIFDQLLLLMATDLQKRNNYTSH